MCKKIAVFGATGFVGQHLVAGAKARGFVVTTIGRNREADIKAELDDFDNIKMLCLPGYDAIIDVAAVNETSIAQDVKKAYDVNVTRSRAIIELAKRNNIKNVSYCSTFHVYGKQSGEISFNTVCTPRNDYGITHYLSEIIYRQMGQQYQISTKIVRPTNIYGLPHSLNSFNRWSLVPYDFVKTAVEDNKITIRSTGLQQRNFVHVANVVDALLNFENKIVDVIGGDTLSIRDFALLVAETLNSEYGEIKVTWVDEDENFKEEPLVFSEKIKLKPEFDADLLAQFIGQFARMYKERS